MQKLTLVATVLLFPFLVSAQKNKKAVADFGKIDKADLEMKTCDIDPKAEAVVLFETGEMNCIISSISVEFDFVHHVRIKILQEGGRNAADIKLPPFYSYKKLEDIRDISAATYNLDAAGNIVKTTLDKKSIFEKQVDKRYSQKVFTFPDVKPGSIIEFKYHRTGPGFYGWYFQRNIPVKYSSYTIDFPDQIEVHCTPHCSLPVDRKFNKDTRIVESFTMKDIPALRNEPYILNPEDYMQRVEPKLFSLRFADGSYVDYLTQWPKVVKILLEDEDFGMQLNKEIPRTADLDALLAKQTDPLLRMMIIHQYVRDNMKWNGMSNIWAVEGIKSAWKDKKGTSGEINLILVNLLKDAGLKAYPVLVSTHDHGLVNKEDAGLNQFNKVLAYVTIDDNIYVLDGTEKNTPSYLIPTDVILNEGMVIEKLETKEWGWKTLWNEDSHSKSLLLTNASIDDKGKMTAEAKLTSYDYARVDRAIYARKGVKDYTDKYLKLDIAGLNVDSVSFENLQVDTLPLTQNIYYTQQLASSGDYKYFSVNQFTGLEKNPFISETRFSDVFYGMNQSYSVIGTYFIPEGYVAEGLPKNMKLVMPDKSITVTRTTQADDISIYVNLSIEFAQPFYPNSQYAEFREFYKKLDDLLNEQFVIKKK